MKTPGTMTREELETLYQQLIGEGAKATTPPCLTEPELVQIRSELPDETIVTDTGLVLTPQAAEQLKPEP